MKRILSFFLMICMLVPLVPASIFAEGINADTLESENASGGKSIADYAADSFEYGDGSVDSPYIIRTPEQLMYFSTSASAGETYDGKYLSLAADIDMSGYDWIPVPTFKGVFNGNNFTIENMSITSGSQVTVDNKNYYLVGFIGHSQGGISNLHFEDISINAYYDGYINNNVTYLDIFCGAIAGVNSGHILYCSVSGSVKADSVFSVTLGGMVGYARHSSSIVSCYVSSETVSNNSTRAGGLVGLCEGIIHSSFSTGFVHISSDSVNEGGGLAGRLDGGSIYNCYSNCDIYVYSSSANVYAGGLFGKIESACDRLENCYYVGGTVNASTDGDNANACSGGVVGLVYTTSTISSCFTSGNFYAHTRVDDFSGDYTSGFGQVGGIGGSYVSAKNCYYSSSSSFLRNTSEAFDYTIEGSGCDSDTTETRYRHSRETTPSYLQGTIVDGANFKSASFITGTLAWSEFKGLSNIGNYENVWVLNGDYPKLYTDYCHGVAVVRKFRDTVIDVDYFYCDNNFQFNYVPEEMPGYVADTASISHTITEDKVYTVTYDYVKHDVLINCRDEEGNLIGTFVERAYENSTFSLTPPSVTGYTPFNTVIEGSMGTNDIEIDVDYYANQYSIKISYQYIDGTEAASPIVGDRRFGEYITIDSPIISGKKFAVDTDSVVVIPRDYAGNFEYIVTYLDSDKLAYTITTMLNTAAGPQSLSEVQVTFNGETKSTDVNGRATFNYEPGTEKVTLKIHKDGFYSGIYENDTEYELKSNIGVDYFNIQYDTVDNPLYFVQGVSCYGNDIEKDYGVINVKYNGYIPIVVKGNVPDNDKIVKMELVQEVESTESDNEEGDSSEVKMVRKILKTVRPGSSEWLGDGQCLFEMLGSQFKHSAYKKYPIYVYMYTEYGNEPVIRELKISTVSFSANFEFGGLFDDASFTLSDTGLSFLDGTKLSLKMNKGFQSEFPFTFEIRNNEVYVGYNMGEDFYSVLTGIDESLLHTFKDNTQERTQKWLDKMTDKVNKKFSKGSWRDPVVKASFQIDADAYGGFCFTINDNHIAKVQSYLKVGLALKGSFTADFVVVFVPVTVTVTVGVTGEITINGLGYDFERKQLLVPDVQVNLSIPIGLSAGIGNRFASVGVFGRIALGTTIVIGETTYLDALVLSGSGGFYAKLDLGLLTLYGEKAWSFPDIPILTTRDSINTENIPAENSDGLIGTYNELPVYDISSYSLAEQAEILDIPEWSVDGATELESPESVSEADRLVTLDASEERIVKIGNQRVVVYFAKDTERVVANAKVLAYRVYDESAGTWTESQIVNDNGTGDTSFDIINYKGQVYLVYGESNLVFDDTMYVDGTSMINEMTFSQDIRVAVYDPSTQTFTDVKEITSDNYYDSIPTFGVVNGELYLAWVQNTAHDDTATFCMNTENYIYYSKLVGTSWTEPEIAVNNCFPVVDMTVVELSNLPCIALIVDEDVSLYSNDDRNIYISDLYENIFCINCYGSVISDLQAVNNDNSSFLLWKSGNEIMMLRSLAVDPVTLSGADNSIGEDYMFVSIDDQTDAILWAVKDIGADDSKSSETSEIRASYSYMGGEWTEPSVLMTLPYHLMSFDAIVCDGNFEIVLTNTNVVTNENGGADQKLNSFSRVFYKSVEVPYIANISDINIEIDKDNQIVNVSFTVSNDGAFPFNTIQATLIDAVKKEVTSSGGRPGGSGSVIIKSAPMSVYSSGIGTSDSKQYTVVYNEYELGELVCELVPGSSAVINTQIDLTSDMVLEDYSIDANVCAIQFSPGSGTGGSSVSGGSSVIVTIIGSKPSSPEGTIVEQLYPDISVSGEYIIIGETEYISLRVENIGDNTASINIVSLYRFIGINDDGTESYERIYDQSFDELLPNQVVYYLVKLEKEFFAATSETFMCTIECRGDQDYSNNSTVVIAHKLEGAAGTERDLLVEVPVLDSYQQTFDKYLPYSSDINIDITMTEDLRSFVGCVDEEQSPVTPYLTEDGYDQHFVFYKEYLSEWETGWHDFSFIYLTDAGYIDILYTINVIDSTPIPMNGIVYITLVSDTSPVNDSVRRGDKLTIDISMLNTDTVTFEWLINGEVVSTEKSYEIDDQYLGREIQAKVKGVSPYVGELVSQVLLIEKVQRQLSAPVIKSASPENVVVLRKTFHVGDDVLYYGFSPTNDGGTVDNWQTSNELSMPDDGAYYLFVKAPGSDIYSEVISSGTLYDPSPDVIVNDVSGVGYSRNDRVISVKYQIACRIGYLQGSTFTIIESVMREDGSYDFAIPEEVEEIILIVVGDVDCNGKLETEDVTQLKNYILDKGGEVSEYGLLAGDVSANDKLTALDLALMNAAAKGKILLAW